MELFAILLSVLAFSGDLALFLPGVVFRDLVCTPEDESSAFGAKAYLSS